MKAISSAWMLCVVLACRAVSVSAETHAAGARERARFIEQARTEAALVLGTDIRQIVTQAPPVPRGRPSQALESSPSQSIEFYVTGTGKGASQFFTKSSCLFCTEFKSQAKMIAEAWAARDAEGQCSARKAFLKERPRIEDMTCTRLDGWESYYSCRAQASATCLLL